MPGVLATAQHGRGQANRAVRQLSGLLGSMTTSLPEILSGFGNEVAVGIGPDVGAPTGVLFENVDEIVLREQLAAFSRVGLAPVFVKDSIKVGTARERSQAGLASAITGFVRSGDRLMMQTDRMMVRFVGDSTEANRKKFLKEHGLVELRTLDLEVPIHMVSAQEANVLELCHELMRNEVIDFAEPDLIEHVGTRTQPNDPKFRDQWHLCNTGQAGGLAGADIKALAAWARTKGSGVRIAVIDNGFDVRHPDLRFAADSGWFRSTPSFDDADFVRGITHMPDNTHGTACAGMATAIADNRRGGAGVAPEAELVAISCLSDQVGNQATLARALLYAAAHAAEDPSLSGGADVIACSLGPTDSAQWPMSVTLSRAIDAVTRRGRDGRGTPVFWAVTNGNFPIAHDEVVSHPRVIRVGRSTRMDTDNGSGYGPELDFLAPGVAVTIPESGGAYSTTTGTSFACPCAAAVGALVLARYPQLTPEALRQKLQQSCDKVGNLPYTGGRNNRFGFGRINADRATV